MGALSGVIQGNNGTLEEWNDGMLGNKTYFHLDLTHYSILPIFRSFHFYGGLHEMRSDWVGADLNGVIYE